VRSVSASTVIDGVPLRRARTTCWWCVHRFHTTHDTHVPIAHVHPLLTFFCLRHVHKEAHPIHPPSFCSSSPYLSQEFVHGQPYAPHITSRLTTHIRRKLTRAAPVHHGPVQVANIKAMCSPGLPCIDSPWVKGFQLRQAPPRS